MADDKKTPAETIAQLELARKAALGDAVHYNQILPGVLSIIGPAAYLEVRRWVAEFTAETFASPSLAHAAKENLAVQVLPTLRSFLDAPAEDAAVVKSAVQTAASLYPLVFKRLIAHPNEAALWQDISAIKLNILQRMDTSPPPIRVCCIKFVQKVVQVQSPGTSADPRRPDLNDISLALVPRNHPVLPLTSLEAEASGLLDRLLGVFQEDPMDPLVIDATLNCLAVLVRTRPSIATKIMAAVLSFNPLRQASSPLTTRSLVAVRSMERTTVALLKWFRRSFRNHPLEAKIVAHIARLDESRKTLLSDPAGIKRPAEPTEVVDDAKRQKLATPARKFPPMPPPPNSLAQLFTLTEDPNLQNLDVARYIPADQITNLAFVFLTHTYPEPLNEAVEEVRRRYAHLKKIAQPTPVPEFPMAGPTGIDDDDDYDPEFISPSDAIIPTQMDSALDELIQPAIELGPFELPKPPPLTAAEVAIVSDQTVGHVFQLVAALESSVQPATKQKLGLNRLAASTNDRDSWATIMIRLATRPGAGLEDLANSLAGDEASDALVKAEDDGDAVNTANRIRQTLFMYILDDFRPRLNVAISWLTEEWYNDTMKARRRQTRPDTPNYSRWSIRLIDRLLPYLDARDKNILIRFLSEIPAVDRDMLERVKALARDPERVGMCMMAMQYLIMMRPPAKEVALDAVENIWHEGDAQTKAAAGKVLARYRPGWNTDGGVAQTKTEDKKMPDGKVNGLKGPPTEATDPRRRRIAVATKVES